MYRDEMHTAFRRIKMDLIIRVIVCEVGTGSNRLGTVPVAGFCEYGHKP
jgi:hypothetical protein